MACTPAKQALPAESPAQTASPGIKGLVHGGPTAGSPVPVRALVIGVSDVGALSTKADFAEAEVNADRMAARLGELFGADRVDLLKGTEATSKRMEDKVAALLDSTTEAEAVILYFATQAATMPASKQAWLMGADTIPEGRLSSTALSTKALRASLSRSKAHAVLIFADVVHDELGEVAGISAGPESAVSSLLVALQDARRNVFVQASGTGVPLEGCSGTSLYTCALLAGLDGQADRNHDGVVAIDELTGGVAGAVSKADQHSTRPQSGASMDPGFAIPVSYTPAKPAPSFAYAEPPRPVGVCLHANEARVQTSHVFRTGDRLRLEVTPPVSGYLYMVGNNPAGEQELLFPWKGSDNFVMGGSTVQIMPADSEEPIIFTDPPGPEPVYLIWSATKMGQSAQVLAAAKRVSEGEAVADAFDDVLPAGSKGLSHLKASVPARTTSCTEYQPEGDSQSWTAQFTLEHR